jgi:hypothetical protein
MRNGLRSLRLAAHASLPTSEKRQLNATIPYCCCLLLMMTMTMIFSSMHSTDKPRQFLLAAPSHEHPMHPPLALPHTLFNATSATHSASSPRTPFLAHVARRRIRALRIDLRLQQRVVAVRMVGEITTGAATARRSRKTCSAWRWAVCQR